MHDPSIVELGNQLLLITHVTPAHQNIQPSPLLHCPVHHRLDVRFLAHIALDAVDLCVGELGSKNLSRFGDGRLVDV